MLWFTLSDQDTSLTMKHGIVSMVIYLGLSTALTPSSLPATAGHLGSSSAAFATYNTAAAPPPPTPGESAGQWIDQLFDNANKTYNGALNNTLGVFGSAISIESSMTTNSATASEPGRKKRKRSYVEDYGLHESIWTNDTSKIGYNISVDFSNCSTGINLSTDIGVYTFTNGTTRNDTTLKAMVTDLWSLRHSATTPNTRYANHTAVVAQQAMDEANQVLKMGLVCQNASASAESSSVVTTGDTTGEVIHVELRKLLANAWSYWASVVLSAGSGAICGVSVAAGMDIRFKGNVTAENTIQTGTVVAITIIIAGILNRLHEVGRLDNAQRIPGAAQAVAANAAQLVPGLPGAREVVAQSTFIAAARRTMQRIASRQKDLEQALSEAGVSVEGSAREVDQALENMEAGIPGTGTSSAGGVRDIEACLSEVEAAEAAEMVGRMNDADLGLEAMEEIQEQLAGRNKDGSCGD